MLYNYIILMNYKSLKIKDNKLQNEKWMKKNPNFPNSKGNEKIFIFNN